MFEALLSRGKGAVHIKNTFSLILRSTCHFSRGLHDGCGPQDYVFLRQNSGICRRVAEEKKPINIYVCISKYVLKFQTNVRMMRTRMDSFFAQDERMSLQPSVIIGQLK